MRRLAVVRDLFGRFRVAVLGDPEGAAASAWRELALELCGGLGAYEVGRNPLVVLEPEAWERFTAGAPCETYGDALSVAWVDRLLVGQYWSAFPAEAADGGRGLRPWRYAFCALKGGVGRSTACAVAARQLAAKGHRVLVVDLDLESPGLGHLLLGRERWPEHGVVDWFVEDAVGQGEAVLASLVAEAEGTEDLPGAVFVAPAHGRQPAGYLDKLGRAYLDRPPQGEEVVPEPWPHRLARCVADLERRTGADVVLLDVRNGLHDVAAAAVTALDAEALLFTTDAAANWAGWRLLFEHWHARGVATRIRERLHMVAAFVPVEAFDQHLRAFRERAWDLFRETMYDEVPAEDRPELEDASTPFSFDLDDQDAPHHPWPILWSQEVARVARPAELPLAVVQGAFGDFVQRLQGLAAARGEGGRLGRREAAP